jgi:hypothetical protein
MNRFPRVWHCRLPTFSPDGNRPNTLSRPRLQLRDHRLDASAPATQQCVAWPGWRYGGNYPSFRLSPRQRSFNWQSTAFVIAAN